MDRKPRTTPDEIEKDAKRQRSFQTWEETDTDTMAMGAPPSYEEAVIASSSTANPQQGRSLVPVADTLDFTPSPLEMPTPAECIAHLKLLHALAKLRQDVGNDNGTHGVSLEKEGGEVDAALAERVREKKWAIFVAQAVDNFERWWKSLPSQYPDSTSVWRTPITTDDFDSIQTNTCDRYKIKSLDRLREENSRAVIRFTEEGEGLDEKDQLRLPPLDVLMVWHAYMLNPRYTFHRSVHFQI